MLTATLRNLWKVVVHKWFVLRAGIRLGGIPLWRLIIHDLSKFSPAEINGYTLWYHAPATFDPLLIEYRRQKYELAWLHHQNHNPHHRQYWFNRKDGTYFEMPEVYAREMVADWMGASRAYTGSWDMQDWLDSNLHYLLSQINENSWVYIEKALKDIGYTYLGE